MGAPGRDDRSANGERRLRITVAPWQEFQRDVIDQAGDVVEGTGEGERLLAFEDIESIQRLLTPKRLKLVKSVMTEPPASIRGLATRLGRTPSEVHGDVHLLEDSGILTLKPDGRAKRPTVPYDSIRIEVTLTIDDDADNGTRGA